VSEGTASEPCERDGVLRSFISASSGCCWSTASAPDRSARAPATFPKR